MKKSVLILNAICCLSFVATSLAQTSGDPLVGPPHDGTSQVTPSMNSQIGDARGTEVERGINQQTPVKPSRQTAREEKVGAQPLSSPEAISTHEPAPAARKGSESLDSTAFAKQLSISRYNARADLLAELDRRTAANDIEINQLKAASVRFSGPARDNFNSAFSEWKSRKKALHDREELARNASPDDWETARAALSNEYESYVVTLTRAEAASALQP